MIKINIKKKDDKVNYVKVSGHAGYAEEGYDIVCASVSSICITTVNAVISINEESIVYTESEGLLEIGIMEHSEVVDKLIENMLDMLTKLAEEYSEYVKISKWEVGAINE